jgi:putative glycerol-1-phosphate prenyltransferase
MNTNYLYNQLLQKKSNQVKSLAVLVDPDKADEKHLQNLIVAANNGYVDYFFVGGSLITTTNLDKVVTFLKQQSKVPVIIFPGSTMQIHQDADGILFLSLISGRNADLLIGRHVEAAPILKNSNLEVISTGYMLIDGGKATSASYMSNTQPLPIDKPEIAVCTAIAGEMLGLKSLYLEAGSGALNPVPPEVVRQVNKNTTLPLIVGGGIRDKETASVICEAGADVIVVGTQIESDSRVIEEIFLAIKTTKTKVL